MIRYSVALHMNLPITKSTQLALQADGQSPLIIKGETRITVTRNKHSFFLEALVVGNIDVDVLAGVPFMDTNDISIRPAKQEIKLGDGTIYHYGIVQQSGPRIMRQALILRSPVTTTLWPGDFIELDVPSDIPLDNPVALEPRITTYINNQLPTSRIWPSPNILTKHRWKSTNSQ